MTYRVNAVRAQSPVRRLVSLGRALTHDGIDADSGDDVRTRAVSRITGLVTDLRKSGIWDTLLKKVLSVQMRRLGVDYTGGATEPEEAGCCRTDCTWTIGAPTPNATRCRSRPS